MSRLLLQSSQSPEPSSTALPWAAQIAVMSLTAAVLFALVFCLCSLCAADVLTETNLERVYRSAECWEMQARQRALSRSCCATAPLLPKVAIVYNPDEEPCLGTQDVPVVFYNDTRTPKTENEDKHIEGS